MVNPWAVLLTCALALTMLAPVKGWADGGPRTALVIGTASYDFGPDLRTPVDDARAVASRLAALGYQTYLASDPTQPEFLTALAHFRVASAQASHVVIYLAGHGLRWRGETYLLARDTPMDGSGTMLARAIPLRVVVAAVSDKVRTKVILIDACRDLPHGADVMVGAPDATEPHAPAGTFMLYAAQPGAVASDGQGAHSPFAAAVLRALSQERPLPDFARAVRSEVVAQTSGLQVPWSESSMLTEVRIGGG